MKTILIILLTINTVFAEQILTFDGPAVKDVEIKIYKVECGLLGELIETGHTDDNGTYTVLYNLITGEWYSATPHHNIYEYTPKEIIFKKEERGGDNE